MVTLVKSCPSILIFAIFFNLCAVLPSSLQADLRFHDLESPELAFMISKRQER